MPPPKQESKDGSAYTNTVKHIATALEIDDDDEDEDEKYCNIGAATTTTTTTRTPSTSRRNTAMMGGRQLKPATDELERLESRIINWMLRQSQLRNSTFRERRRKSFIVEFSKMNGPPQIAILMALLALALGSTIGIVPAIMSDRFARLNHGYNGAQPCDDSSSLFNTTSVEDIVNIDDLMIMTTKPIECTLGAADAQAAASIANLIQNVFTFVTASSMGSISDEYGRKGPLLIGLAMTMIPSLCLYVMNYVPDMSPWWYYTASAVQGLVSWMAIALIAMNDLLPKEFRAAGIGLLFAGLLFGISVAPTVFLYFNRTTLCSVSFLVLAFGFISTIIFVPETLSPDIAQETKQKRLVQEKEIEEREAEIRMQLQKQLQKHYGNGSFPSYLWLGLKQSYYGSSYICRILRYVIRFVFIRPVREMSILTKNSLFRILSALAFFTGMVQHGDQVLLLYYLEDHLNFDQHDVSSMFLIIGVTGIVVQVFLMKPLNDLVGEKFVIVISFLSGSIVNFLYGVAQSKSTIFAALMLSGFAHMSFPTISAIKANNADPTELGRIQGALYSVKALASGIGPAVLQFVYSRTNNNINISSNSPQPHSHHQWWIGPGSMWLFASFLLLIAVGLAMTLPNDDTTAKLNNNKLPYHDDFGHNPNDDMYYNRENELGEEYQTLLVSDDDRDESFPCTYTNNKKTERIKSCDGGEVSASASSLSFSSASDHSTV